MQTVERLITIVVKTKNPTPYLLKLLKIGSGKHNVLLHLKALGTPILAC
jgi:hypothetical protein